MQNILQLVEDGEVTFASIGQRNANFFSLDNISLKTCSHWYFYSIHPYVDLHIHKLAVFHCGGVVVCACVIHVLCECIWDAPTVPPFLPAFDDTGSLGSPPHQVVYSPDHMVPLWVITSPFLAGGGWAKTYHFLFPYLSSFPDKVYR